MKVLVFPEIRLSVMQKQRMSPTICSEQQPPWIMVPAVWQIANAPAYTSACTPILFPAAWAAIHLSALLHRCAATSGQYLCAGKPDRHLEGNNIDCDEENTVLFMPVCEAYDESTSTKN